jgi:hypothetical protein
VVGFTPLRFNPGERVLSTHCIIGCVGPRAGPDVMDIKEKKTHAENRTQTLGRPIRHVIAIPTELSRGNGGRTITCHLKGHLFKLGLTDDPICDRCLEEDGSAPHILCDCEAIAYLRFRHLGQFSMEPSDYYDAPIYRVLHFIRGVGLIKRGSTIDHWRSRCKGRILWPTPHTYIHTYIHTYLEEIIK